MLPSALRLGSQGRDKPQKYPDNLRLIHVSRAAVGRIFAEVGEVDRTLRAWVPRTGSRCTRSNRRWSAQVTSPIPPPFGNGGDHGRA